MKKLCFFIYNFNKLGGMEKTNSILINELAKLNRYDITLLSLFGVSGHERFELLDSSYVRVKYLFDEEFNIRRNSKVVIDTIENEVLSNNFEVVISGDLRTYFAKIKKRNKNKFRLILWEHFNCTQPHSITADLGRMYFLKYTDKLVVLTKRDQSNYIRKFNHKDKITQIHNPLIAENVRLADVSKKRILSIGRVEEQKGFDQIIEIGKQIAKYCDSWEWHIYGDGWELAALSHRVLQEGLDDFIKFKGMFNQIEEVYPYYSIFAMTSRYEGMPLVLLEAYAHHIPMISFDCDCGPSEIIQDGKNGFLIPFFDNNLYSEKLLLLVKDDKLRMQFSENCSLHMEEFDLEFVLKQWENLLE